VKESQGEAVEALFRALRQPSLSLRRAAVQALLSTKDAKELRPRVSAYLPPEEHFLLELTTPEVSDVPQVERPERFLSEEARRSPSAKAPGFPVQEESPRRERPPRSGGKKRRNE
jgi:hypothetical protein